MKITAEKTYFLAVDILLGVTTFGIWFCIKRYLN
jgi:hypothetical protein